MESSCSMRYMESAEWSMARLLLTVISDAEPGFAAAKAKLASAGAVTAGAAERERSMRGMAIEAIMPMTIMAAQPMEMKMPALAKPSPPIVPFERAISLREMTPKTTARMRQGKMNPNIPHTRLAMAMPLTRGAAGDL